MLDRTLCILNFDDSVVKQKSLLSKYQARIIDLSRLSSKARLWMNKSTRQVISERINNLGGNNCVHFLGSGDFHHISEVLTSRIKEPVCVIVFDFHPDWDTMPPKFGCGSWVSAALDNKNIVKCLLLGPSSEDISGWYLRSANLGALNNDRLEIYPYEHKPSSVFFRGIPKNSSFDFEDKFIYKKIHWRQLKNQDLAEFFSGLLKRIPVKKVYLSIDKDCLRSEHALTNWEEGKLSLDELLLLARLIKENMDLVGVDIVGEHSPVAITNKLKSLISRLDHPRDFSAANIPESQITAINESTNLKILETLFE